MIAEQAATMLDQHHKQVQQQMVQILETHQQEKTEKNRDNWQMIHDFV